MKAVVIVHPSSAIQLQLAPPLKEGGPSAFLAWCKGLLGSRIAPAVDLERTDAECRLADIHLLEGLVVRRGAEWVRTVTRSLEHEQQRQREGT